ncbi:carbonic anhydrase-domain-containing protein [Xylogone sp. PMI_703]|nr:carbonic anhydrase-domain-containing protein [Xylogone sp. PMI_703]
MATWDELLERNKKYSETTHKPQPYISEFTGLPPPFFIVSCIDFRVSVEDLLGIKTEDAFIIRNAGGRIRSSFTDLLFIETFMKEQAVKNVVVIHHTGNSIPEQAVRYLAILTALSDCGFTHNTDDGIKEQLKAKAPHLAQEIDQLYFGTFGSSDMLEESIREYLKFLKSQPLIKQEIKDKVKGYVYDIKTGKLNPVPYEG